MASTALERLKLLYDYEKFHIGLYGAMISGFAAILKWSTPPPWMTYALALAILFLLVAAVCGAILASSVIDVYGNYNFWPPRTQTEAEVKAEAEAEAALNRFWSEKIGPYKRGWLKAKTWWRVGHTAFWMATFLVVGSFLTQIIQVKCECTGSFLTQTIWHVKCGCTP